MKRKSSLRSLKNKAWKIVSEFVRRKDADEGGTTQCYTCGSYLHWKYEAQAGHAIPGRHNAVLLDLEILRPQCYRCNCAMGGQYHIFATKLIKEHGMDWWDQKLIDSRKVVKYTAADLEDLIEELKIKLEKLNEPRTENQARGNNQSPIHAGSRGEDRGYLSGDEENAPDSAETAEAAKA